MTQQATAESPAPASGNWWGETPVWATAVQSPTAAARQVLVEACGSRGITDRTGQPLDDVALLQRARVATHPDRLGSQEAWDRVHAAGVTLGLITHPSIH